VSQSILFPIFGNRPHRCWGSAIFYFGNLTEHPASEVAVIIAAKNVKTLENQGFTEIKQNPENFFSGSFLLVDHQGLEQNVWGQELREMEGLRTVQPRAHSKSTQKISLYFCANMIYNISTKVGDVE